MKNKAVCVRTFFDRAELQKAVLLCEEAGLTVALENRSGAPNYRVPGSAFVEVDLMCDPADEAAVRKILEPTGDE